jgi:hypothetical protein
MQLDREGSAGTRGSCGVVAVAWEEWDRGAVCDAGMSVGESGEKMDRGAVCDDAWIIGSGW